jgi:hypothetical protein
MNPNDRPGRLADVSRRPRARKIWALLFVLLILAGVLRLAWNPFRSANEQQPAGTAGLAEATRFSRAASPEYQALKTHSRLASPRRNPLYDTEQARPEGEVQYTFDQRNGRVLQSRGRDENYRPDSDAPSGWNLWLKEPDGRERLIHPNVYRAKFSPDGGQIAYATSDGTLYIEDMDGWRSAEIEGAHDPNWRPDGQAVSFVKVPEGRSVHTPETLHLAAYDLRSGELMILTDGSYDDVRPQYDPSGERILFVSGGRSGLASFWEIPADGGEPVQVTNIGLDRVNEDFVPTPYDRTLWSSDQRWFLYDFKKGEQEEIWGLQFGPGGTLQRAEKLADGLEPQWRLDGRTFAYRQRDGNDVRVVEAVLP